MSLLSTACAAVIIAAPAPTPMGSIYGKVATKASYYLTKTGAHSGFARRQTLPSASLREPRGVIVALNGSALEQKKFEAPTDEVKLEWKAMGLQPRLIGCQVGSPLVIKNNSNAQIVIAGAAFLKDPVPPQASVRVKLPEVGVFELFEQDHKDARITLVVTPNPFIIALDESGEFLFDDLLPGPYTIEVFARTGMRRVPVVVKEQEREHVKIALEGPLEQKSEEKLEAPQQEATP